MDKNGLNGQAEIVYSNGDKYEGHVAKGQKSGQGSYSWKNGASYNGAWKNDTMHGKGVYVYPKKSKGYQLDGSFNNGVPNGKCEYYTSASTSYQTDWKKGKCVKIYE